MATRTISEQIIDFVKAHALKINRESFSVIEFICQKGKLDGMRIKQYIKAEKEK